MEEMDLLSIREEIDKINNDIIDLYIKRMRLAEGVADYKLRHSLPVFQSSREDEILNRVEKNSPPDLAQGARLLFTEILDISKCHQQNRLTKLVPLEISATRENPIVGCPGISGSYSEEACHKAFGGRQREIRFFKTFDEVFEAVDSGSVDYGVVPLENSTAGGVGTTYDLMGKHDFHICRRLSIPINHVLAAKSDTAFTDVKTVISHEHALNQCSQFLKAGGAFKALPAANTSIAAKTVADSGERNIACICSAACAKLYGLSVLKENISNCPDNFTRFIVISKALEVSENADIVTLSLSLPHSAGALYRMLTRFAFSGLNLTKIESKPVPLSAGKDSGDSFGVIFYLDFNGSIKSDVVAKLLQNLKNESEYYKLLGNYEDMQ